MRDKLVTLTPEFQKNLLQGRGQLDQSGFVRVRRESLLNLGQRTLDISGSLQLPRLPNTLGYRFLSLPIQG